MINLPDEKKFIENSRWSSEPKKFRAMGRVDGFNECLAEVHRLNATAQPVIAPEWTNEQCLDFLSIAFRHANISGDIDMDDIRLGIRMVNSASGIKVES